MIYYIYIIYIYIYIYICINIFVYIFTNLYIVKSPLYLCPIKLLYHTSIGKTYIVYEIRSK